jgi:prepilin-type N-terminal cleavage/methylation domain-containing protein
MKGATVMMQISENNKNKYQRGVTLFELLIVLALIALMTAIASANISGASTQRAITTAAHQMRADFIRARMHADATNSSINIHLSETGYSIPALNINRTLSRKMRVRHEGSDVIMLGPGSWLRGYTIKLMQGSTSASITIAPLTRKIDVENE